MKTAYQILHSAETAGFLRCIRVEMGACDLELFVSDDANLDDRFPAICAETGDRLMVNGWLISSVEG